MDAQRGSHILRADLRVVRQLHSLAFEVDIMTLIMLLQ
jgi:hypothetical protein